MSTSASRLRLGGGCHRTDLVAGCRRRGGGKSHRDRRAGRCSRGSRGCRHQLGTRQADRRGSRPVDESHGRRALDVRDLGDPGRPVDVDLPALQRRGIAWAGTNERHPTVDVFSHLGTMAIRLLTDARYAVHGARVVVLCDNPFAPYLADSLAGVGDSPYVAASLEDVPDAFDPDVVADRPAPARRIRPLDDRSGKNEASLAGDPRRTVLGRPGPRRAAPPRPPSLAPHGTASRAHGGPAVGHRARAGRPAPGWRAEGRLRAASAARAAQRLRQELPR